MNKIYYSIEDKQVLLTNLKKIREVLKTELPKGKQPKITIEGKRELIVLEFILSGNLHIVSDF